MGKIEKLRLRWICVVYWWLDNVFGASELGCVSPCANFEGLTKIRTGGVNYPWGSWKTIIPLSVGLVGFVAFGLHSAYIARDPFIHGSIFSSLSASVNYICTAIHGMIIWGALYYMPLYFEVVKGLTPLGAGIALLPFTLTTGPAAVAVGIVIAATGKYRPSLVSTSPK